NADSLSTSRRSKCGESSTHQPPSFSFLGITEQAPQAFAPLFDDLFAIGNAGLDRFLFRNGDEVERGHFSSRRHAGRGVLPDVVLVVPANAVFEFVGSGADGEALILDLRHVHFPWCSSRPTESDYRQDVEQFVLGGCSWRGHRYSVTCHAGRWR